MLKKHLGSDHFNPVFAYSLCAVYALRPLLDLDYYLFIL